MTGRQLRFPETKGQLQSLKTAMVLDEILTIPLLDQVEWCPREEVKCFHLYVKEVLLQTLKSVRSGVSSGLWQPRQASSTEPRSQITLTKVLRLHRASSAWVGSWISLKKAVNTMDHELAAFQTSFTPMPERPAISRKAKIFVQQVTISPF